MYAVFNSANADSAISASRPYLRILASNMMLHEAQALEKTQPIETRIWKMSDAKNIYWRTISNLNLLIYKGSEKIEAVLLEEYATFDQKVLNWNAYRNEKYNSVMQAKHERRGVQQIYAENLLASNAKAIGQTNGQTTGQTIEVKRDEEIRGQNWALIAIMGDSTYEIAKESYMNELGLDFFCYLNECLELKIDCFTQPSNQDIILQAFNSLDAEVQETLKTNFEFKIMECQNKIQSLINEPLVAFFGVAERPEDLEKQSDELSKLDSLKNSDIAIVRMYSWLNLSKANSVKAKHTSRDPRANEFFNTMRSTLNH